jgi:hypothetical protein
MLNSYAELCAYWRGLTATVPQIKKITVGDDEQVIDSQTQPGVALYPHLRVDTPDIKYLNGDENLVVQYTYTLFVFAPEATKRTGAEDAVLSTMELALRAVYRRLHTDAWEDVFDLVPAPNSGDAIRAWSGDNCFGWTMKVAIQIYANEC